MSQCWEASGVICSTAACSMTCSSTVDNWRLAETKLQSDDEESVVQPGRSQIRNLVVCLSQAGRVCFSQCNTESRGTCYGRVLLGREGQILVRENSWILSSGASSLHQVILKGLESQHNKNVVAVYSRVWLRSYQSAPQIAEESALMWTHFSSLSVKGLVLPDISADPYHRARLHI